MDDQKNSTQGFYAEALRPSGRLAIVGDGWEPKSLESSRKVLESVAAEFGVEYRPEAPGVRRRLLQCAAVDAWEIGRLRIVFAGSYGFSVGAWGVETELEPILVCLYSHWPSEYMDGPVEEIPPGARLIHSVVAGPDLIGDCLRVVDALHDLGTENDPVWPHAQYPAAA
jgi:hypothetical protein